MNKEYDTINRNKVATQNQCFSISKWNNTNVMEWLKIKLPMVYDQYKDIFIQNGIDGETLLVINETCLDNLNIHNTLAR
jgi:hypothetical protein